MIETNGKDLRFPTYEQVEARKAEIYNAAQRLAVLAGEFPWMKYPNEFVDDEESYYGDEHQSYQTLLLDPGRTTPEYDIEDPAQSALILEIDNESIVHRSLDVLKDILSEANLNDREKRVIELKFGFAEGGAITLKEVAEKVGVSLERISQIEEKALAKLRYTASKLGIVREDLF